jgi:hypothetical protein
MVVNAVGDGKRVAFSDKSARRGRSAAEVPVGVISDLARIT